MTVLFDDLIQPFETRGARTITAVRCGSLFSGYGGLDLAVHAVLGGRPAWFAEYEPPSKSTPRPGQGPGKVLAARFPGVPNHGDVTAVDWAGVEPVDVLTGGFPCQDVSHAGRRAGLRLGTRSGLWARMADAIDHLRPSLVVAENVRGLLSAAAHSNMEPCPWCLGDAGGREPPLRALGAVLADLAELGYDAAWHGLRAADVGAPHGRFRVFIVAWPTADADSSARGERRLSAPGQAEGWRPRADAGGRDRAPAAHPDSDAVRQQPEPEPRRGSAPVAELARPDAAADTTGDGRDEGRPEPARLIGGPDAALGGDDAWGAYGPAIRRWERTLGRIAPSPTEPGRGGRLRLSPRFVEFMMGLPDGWVCDIPGISRNDQLKMLGNGVVPQQAEAALRTLLTVALDPG